MDFVIDIAWDALKDTGALVPFLFATYLVLETLEHAAGGHINALVKRAGAAGPVVGAVLGIVPQCGFSAMGATLYAGRVVTLGTLIAVFLSTSDEMLPLLVAEHMDVAVMARILLVKAGIAALMGCALDAALRLLRANARVHAAIRRTVLGPRAERLDDSMSTGDVLDEIGEAGDGPDHIHRLCDRDHCGCGEVPAVGEAAAGASGHGHAHGGHDHGHGRGCAEGHGHSHDHGGFAWGPVVRSALSHTVQVTVFIFLITLALVAVLDTVGEPALKAFLSGNRVLAVFASGLVGLIPNCAASVVITQLYLEQVLSFGPMIAGSLVAVGVGFLVLFRTNRSVRENAIILGLLYAMGTAWGLLFTLLGW